VSTRWDSTAFMLIRAVRLQDTITKFCSEYFPAQPFSLIDQEWKQIKYLIDILRPFNFFTQTVSKTKGITLPYVLSIYDELFERLSESRRRLLVKVSSCTWVKPLIQGISAAENKLDDYYHKTYSNLGSIYGIGAILNPKLKLEAFDPNFCWLDPTSRDWAREFEDQFRELFRQGYKDRSSNSEHLRTVREANMDPLALVLDRNRTTRDISEHVQPGEEVLYEVDEWLAMSKYYTNLSTNLVLLYLY
jgi:hypothetical protein